MRSSCRIDALVLLTVALSAGVAGSLAAQPGSGRIAGRIVDRATARPLASVRVVVVSVAGTVLTTDLDGRFRSAEVPAGVHSVRLALIGYRPQVIDSIAVEAGRTTTLNLAMESAPLELEELVVEGAAARRTATEAGLLAEQQAAPVVSDGLSAETLKRTPDSDAGDAIARVTGVSVVDKKFVVVRGLSERYSTTVLNGSELPSPEPLKRVVPLDIFPASLLESIVTTKGATPDKPGDFAGGVVEIQTKEFPDEFTAQVKVSQEYNSTSTFELGALAPRGGTDFLAFDDGRRAMPVNPPAPGGDAVPFAESVRNLWTPTPSRVRPNTGFSANIGGQLDLGGTPLGMVAAVTYSSKSELQPDRVFQFVDSRETGQAIQGSIYDDATSTVDWGAIANLSTRLGQNHKLGLKNFYTRSAEEFVSRSRGFNNEQGLVLERFQVRYVERDLFQSQLSGEHYLPGLGDSRIEWRATYGKSGRDEPENRTLQYQPSSTSPIGIRLIRQSLNTFWFRFLDDEIGSGQLDWTFPISLRTTADASLKVGGSARRKDRSFDVLGIGYRPASIPPDGNEVLDLPPEQALAPENLGRNIEVFRNDGPAISYQALDDVYAGYAMADFEVVPSVRLVGGLRVEEWRINLRQGTPENPVGEQVMRRDRDYLWSASATARVSDVMNVRLGASRTVNRPDTRELSPDEYGAVGGECTNQGNPEVQRAKVFNLDGRWELYPRAGELIAVSGFYKEFADPIVETVDTPSGGDCRITYRNAESGENLGLELEVRKQLDFLPGAFANLAAGMNLTVVRSRATLGEGFVQSGDLPLVGQSPLLINGSLSYRDSRARFDASVLVNYFDDRVVRYGLLSASGPEPPHVTELGRMTLDAKVEKGFGALSLSLSGRNLTNRRYELYQPSDIGRVITGLSRPGTSVSLGVGYDF